MIQNGPELVKAIGESTTTTTIAVVASATGYSAVYDLVDLSVFALEYQVACTGSPNITVTIEQSTDNSNWAEPDNMKSVVTNLTNKNLHSTQINPVTLRYIRFKVVELTTTVSDTVLSIKLSAQKRFSA